MTHIDNRSGFPAELLSVPDQDGQEAQVLVVSATWVQSRSVGVLEPAPEQRPVQLADECFGDAPTSSIRYEAQCAAQKPRVDVIVNGHAYAPGGRPVPQVTVQLEAGPIRKQVRVLGDRLRGLLGASSPAPFVVMPVIYERAYGGTEPIRGRAWRRNPVGVGYREARSQSPDVLTDYPNLEPVGSSLESAPAGFGSIGRGWSPRLEAAGTFDAAWLQDQWPLMPRDFSIAHNQSAPFDQQVEALRTGDPIRLVNLTPDGLWEFALPSIDVSVWLLFDAGRRQAFLRMDTLLIEPDALSITLTSRLDMSLARGRERLREIVVGPVTPGMLRAKERRKPYIHPRDLGKRGDEKVEIR